VALEERGVATRPGLNAVGVPRELLRAPSMRILASLCSVLWSDVKNSPVMSWLPQAPAYTHICSAPAPCVAASAIDCIAAFARMEPRGVCI
jgi:hypothetical protein